MLNCAVQRPVLPWIDRRALVCSRVVTHRYLVGRIGPDSGGSGETVASGVAQAG